MPYSVTLSGYRPGLDPKAVDEALARVFKQDVSRMGGLVSRGATIKRGIDLPTAERFRAAIEQAGALCAIEDESAALTIDVPEDPPRPVATTADAGPSSGEERVLLEFDPSLKGYVGSLIIGTLLLPVAIGLLVFAWIFISWKSTHYKLTSERFFVRRGFISRQQEEIQLYRVQDVTFSQGALERIFGIGSVTLLSADPSAPHVVVRGIDDPEQVKETIRTAYRAARRREGVRTGERILE